MEEYLCFGVCRRGENFIPEREERKNMFCKDINLESCNRFSINYGFIIKQTSLQAKI
jgi:hypothetical protein